MHDPQLRAFASPLRGICCDVLIETVSVERQGNTQGLTGPVRGPIRAVETLVWHLRHKLRLRTRFQSLLGLTVQCRFRGCKRRHYVHTIRPVWVYPIQEEIIRNGNDGENRETGLHIVL